MFTNNFNARGTIIDALGFANGTVGYKPAVHSVYDGTSVSGGFKPIDDLMKVFNTHSLTKKSTSSGGDGTGYYGVCFGDGTTEPTVEDVCLSGVQHTSISKANTLITFNYSTEDNGDFVLTAVYTITNTLANDITIAEVGLAAKGSYFYGGYNYHVPILVEHSLLEIPITIPAGGVGQVTYTIRMNYPTA